MEVVYLVSTITQTVSAPSTVYKSALEASALTKTINRVSKLVKQVYVPSNIDLEIV